MKNAAVIRKEALKKESATEAVGTMERWREGWGQHTHTHTSLFIQRIPFSRTIYREGVVEDVPPSRLKMDLIWGQRVPSQHKSGGGGKKEGIDKNK